MNVINRKSKAIAKNTNRNRNNTFITLDSIRIHITVATILMCDLKPGEYLHFLNDDDQWSFFSNDDPDGFKLTTSIGNSNFHITNTGLVNMIRKSTGFNSKGNKRYYVEKTNIMHDRCEVFRLKS